MSARPWYKRYPSDFIAGTISLTLEEAGAYSYVIDLIHDRGGPIPDDPQWIARVCGCSTRKWNTIRKNLIQAGKIFEKNGFISSLRAEKDAINSAKEGRKLSESGTKGALKTNEKRSSTNENNTIEEKGPEKTGRHTRSQIPDTREASPPVVPLTEIPLEYDRQDEGEAVRLWNEMAERAGLSSVQKITKARRTALKRRLADCGGLEGWKAALSKIENTPWMTGENREGRKWNIDTILGEKVFTKLMEGGYENGPSTRPNSPHDTLYAAGAVVAAQGVDRPPPGHGGAGG